ncbi:PTS sugar transporter subunit IIA [Jeotgalibaca caeni]|uniref:PTS sugar transporter subunit IIA n=1 Tax=Jeotgalibaca caeni TaxID=3028623 RepID=UPI00237E55C8|nr:fructose PTS transporter subunit IIA [Jeotgalibaca caeni]MDE1549310.1 fructose PTS transporter subunit IIA [Jeotgalibaca caeni]
MEIIAEEFIQLDVSLKDKDAVIAYITDLLKNKKRIDDPAQLKRDILLREEEASTSMGLAIAIPHAKSVAVKETTVVFLRLNPSIQWNSDAGIQMIFGIFVPAENVENQHLKILSSLARKLANENFREQLLQVPTPTACKDLLQALNQA